MNYKKERLLYWIYLSTPVKQTMTQKTVEYFIGKKRTNSLTNRIKELSWKVNNTSGEQKEMAMKTLQRLIELQNELLGRGEI